MIQSIIDPQLDRGTADNQVFVWNNTTKRYVPSVSLSGLTLVSPDITGTVNAGGGTTEFGGQVKATSFNASGTIGLSFIFDTGSDGSGFVWSDFGSDALVQLQIEGDLIQDWDRGASLSTIYRNLAITVPGTDAVLTMDGSGDAPGTLRYESDNEVFIFDKDLDVTGNITTGQYIGITADTTLMELEDGLLTVDGNLTTTERLTANDLVVADGVATLDVNFVTLTGFGNLYIPEIKMTTLNGAVAFGSINTFLYIRSESTTSTLGFSNATGAIRSSLVFTNSTKCLDFTGADLYAFDNNLTVVGNVRIGDTTAPTHALEVAGVVKSESGRIPKDHLLTANTTIDETYDEVFCDTDSAGFTVTLPAIPVGQRYRIINAGSNTLTIDPNGNNIVGSSINVTLNAGDILIIKWQATKGWW